MNADLYYILWDKIKWEFLGIFVGQRIFQKKIRKVSDIEVFVIQKINLKHKTFVVEKDFNFLSFFSYLKEF